MALTKNILPLYFLSSWFEWQLSKFNVKSIKATEKKIIVLITFGPLTHDLDFTSQLGAGPGRSQSGTLLQFLCSNLKHLCQIYHNLGSWVPLLCRIDHIFLCRLCSPTEAHDIWMLISIHFLWEVSHLFQSSPLPFPPFISLFLLACNLKKITVSILLYC